MDAWWTWQGISAAGGVVGWLFPWWNYPRWMGFSLAAMITVQIMMSAVFLEAIGSGVEMSLVVGTVAGILLTTMLWLPFLCLCGDWPILRTILGAVFTMSVPLLAITSITELATRNVDCFGQLQRDVPGWYGIWFALISLRLLGLWAKNKFIS